MGSKKPSSKHKPVKIERAHTQLLKDAAELPGVAEVMKVFDSLHKTRQAYLNLATDFETYTVSTTNTSCE